jgi:hypothetical protein
MLPVNIISYGAQYRLYQAVKGSIMEGWKGQTGAYPLWRGGSISNLLLKND